MLAALAVCLAAGCSPSKPVDRMWEVGERFDALCDEGRFVEALLEVENMALLTRYELEAREMDWKGLLADESAKPRLRWEIGEVVRQLQLRKNLDQLEMAVKLSPYMPHIGEQVRRAAVWTLDQPASATAEELVAFVEENRFRLAWNHEKGQFAISTNIPIGQLLPPGFEPLPEQGAASDGYPWRIRCVKDGAEMVYVPPGRTSRPSSITATWVRVGGFYIDKYEVTNAQYAQFCKETGHAPMTYPDPGMDGPRQPVSYARIEDADAYAKWARKVLPSEREWTRAAYADKRTQAPWGKLPKVEFAASYPAKDIDQLPQNIGDLDQYAILNRKGPGRGGYPADVGGRPRGASPFGAEDMLGNIQEIARSTFEGGRQVMDWPYFKSWIMEYGSHVGTVEDNDPHYGNGIRCVLLLGE
jgi:hypothetical protein